MTIQPLTSKVVRVDSASAGTNTKDFEISVDQPRYVAHIFCSNNTTGFCPVRIKELIDDEVSDVPIYTGYITAWKTLLISPRRVCYHSFRVHIDHCLVGDQLQFGVVWGVPK